MTDPRHQGAAYHQNPTNFKSSTSTSTTQHSYHSPATSMQSYSSFVPSAAPSTTTSSSNQSTTASTSRSSPLQSSSSSQYPPAAARWKAFPATTAGVVSGAPSLRPSSSWKSNNTVGGRRPTTTTMRNNNNDDDSSDPEVLTLPSEEDSLQSMPSTEIASNGQHLNKQTTALHQKWRTAAAAQSNMRQKSPADSPSPSSGSTVVCPSRNKPYRGANHNYLAPSASWIKGASHSSTTLLDGASSSSPTQPDEDDSITSSRTAPARPRLTSPPQQQLPMWKQQLLKQRQDRSVEQSSPTPAPSSITTSGGTNNNTTTTARTTSPAATMAPSLEAKAETTTPRPSLVSERLAQFSGGTPNKSVPVVRPKQAYQPQPKAVPKKDKPALPATPPQRVVDEPRSPVVPTTTTPTRTTRYVPPPTHHSFVPLSSTARSPARSPPVPPTSNSSHSRRPPATTLEIVPEPPSISKNNKSTNHWISPRTKRVQALATMADDSIGELKVLPTESEGDDVVVVAATARSTPTPHPTHDDRAGSDPNSVPPLAEQGILETPGKISVKEMKAKLWEGGGTKLKVVAAPAVPPKIGIPPPKVRTPPRHTATATTNPSSPPPSRIAKNLIDVATPQGLAPPVRNSPYSNSSSSSHRKKMPALPDAEMDMPFLPEEDQQQDMLLETSGDGVEMVLGESVESDGTGPRLPAWSGRSFKANVASVLAPAGANSLRSKQQQQPPWTLRRRDVMLEEKKSSESVTTERSLNEGFDVSPADDDDGDNDDVSVEVAEQVVDISNLHSRSASIGDFQIDEASAPSTTGYDNGVEAPVPLAPTTPPTSQTAERPLSGRPSSDEPDFPPLQMSMSPSSSSQNQKPPLSPTAPLQKRKSFVETIDCPPSDDLGDEEKYDAAYAGTDDIYAERLPMTPSRCEVARPWIKDVNTLSPASWQRKKLEENNNILDHSSSSRENRSPAKSNAEVPAESQAADTSYSTPVKSQQNPCPGSTLLQMAADSIHALDFEQVLAPQPVMSEDGSDSLLSDFMHNNGGAVTTTTTTSSVPAHVPPEFQQTIADNGGELSSLPRKLRVADRARALAQWNGGLGAPLRPDDDDESAQNKIDDNAPELSPIRPHGSDSGVEAMSPRLDHRGTALDDWQQNKSFNSSSFEQNSEFDHAPQFGDSLADDKDWSIDENDPNVDLDPFGVAPITPAATSEEVSTVASSVKPIGKPRRDSEPRKQKDRRKRSEAVSKQQVVQEEEEVKERKGRSTIPVDPFAVDEKMPNHISNQHAEEEENDCSTTFDFDPFAVDGYGEKVEFTETTEFTEGSDFFGAAAPVLFSTTTSVSQDFLRRRNFTDRNMRSSEDGLNRVDTDFWSYEADISTFLEDDSTRHIEI